MKPSRQKQFQKRLRLLLHAPRQLRPTRAGWMFLLINFGIGFAALNTGNNLLYLVLSLLLAFLTLSGILSEAALRGLEIKRTLPREVFAGADNFVRIEVRNAQKKVPSFAILVEDRLGPEPAADEMHARDWRLIHDRELETVGRIFALRVGPEQVESRGYALHPESRGAIHFHGARVSTRFPFGLFLKSRTIHAPDTALVFPRIEARDRPPEVEAGNDNDCASTQTRATGTEVSGLREWEIGDSLRRVHWKSSLRRDHWLVRTQESDEQAQIEVRLRTDGAPAPDKFEREVSWAASEVVHHLEAGLRVGLITDHEHIPADAGAPQRARLLSYLALVETAASRRDSNRSNNSNSGGNEHDEAARA